MRVAVVGGGISGMGTSFLLAPHASVTLFESESRLGGHANTALIRHEGDEIPVDTGFMVFNPVRYPYFVALLKELDVASVETIMSFSVSIPETIEYSSDFAGLFGDVSQLTRLSYWRLLFEIIRFNRMAKRYVRGSNPDRALLLGDFLDRHGFSEKLSCWYLFPMMGSIWSAAPEEMRRYPAYESFRFLDNHLLLNIFNKPRWRTVKGGSRSYVDSLEKRLTSEGVIIRTGTNINSITRSHAGVTIETSGGRETFDRVIIATHADTALSLLRDASAEERKILGAFSYTKNTVVLHRDTSFMPQRRGAWASWNYHSAREDQSTISLTYNMNSLQHIPEKHPVFVTLNPTRAIPAEATYATYSYSHPIFNADARDAQENIASLQGPNTYFAGAHLGFGFHEDGLASAVRAVQALGFPIRLEV